MNLKDLDKQLKKALEETLKEITKPSNMQAIGNELKEDIIKRTRLGYGTDKNGSQRRKLEPLSDSYVEQRRNKLGFWTNNKGKAVPISTDKSKLSKKQVAKNKRYLKQNAIKLDSTTRPKKSNLTQTGTMLSFLGVVAGFGRAVIGFKTSKQGIKAGYVSKKRPFMFATKQQINRLTQSVRRKLDVIVNKKIKF